MAMGGKLDPELRHPAHDVRRERVAVGTGPEPVLAGVRVVVDRLQYLGNGAGRSRSPKLLHEPRRLTVPRSVRQIRRRCNHVAAPPAAPANDLVDHVAARVLGLGCDPGMHGKQAPPVERACCPDRNNRFPRLVRRRRDSGAGSVRGAPVLPEPHGAASQCEHRTDQQYRHEEQKLPYPVHGRGSGRSPKFRPSPGSESDPVAGARLVYPDTMTMVICDVLETVGNSLTS